MAQIRLNILLKLLLKFNGYNFRNENYLIGHIIQDNKYKLIYTGKTQ